MIAKIVFVIATIFFGASLFSATVTLGENTVPGVQAFFSAIKYGTAGIFSAKSFGDFITYFLALMAAGANFVFVFWAMLVFSPTKVTSLKWFWWLSLLFIVAAAYIGVLITFDDRAVLQSGYYFWLGALMLMFVAPVVGRMERRRALVSARRSKAA